MPRPLGKVIGVKTDMYKFTFIRLKRQPRYGCVTQW